MSLINCKECNNQVSSKAKSCPKCGAPISNGSEGSGSHTITIQRTSKRLKLQRVLSLLVFCIGLFWSAVNEGKSVVAAILLFGGIFAYIVTRLQTWWSHK